MSSMASTTASRAAAAEARHGLRHEAADTAIAELKAAAAAVARLKAELSALPFVWCLLYTTYVAQSTAGAAARLKKIKTFIGNGILRENGTVRDESPVPSR